MYLFRQIGIKLQLLYDELLNLFTQLSQDLLLNSTVHNCFKKFYYTIIKNVTHLSCRNLHTQVRIVPLSPYALPLHIPVSYSGEKQNYKG